MPLVADISEENVIVCVINIDIVIESDEFISRDSSIVDREKRNEVVLYLLGCHPSCLVVLNYARIEVLLLIELSLLNCSTDIYPFLSLSMLSNMCSTIYLRRGPIGYLNLLKNSNQSMQPSLSSTFLKS